MTQHPHVNSILRDLEEKYHTGPLEAHNLFLPSCGLMGDAQVYGYAWALKGVTHFNADVWHGLLHEAATRLTNEVTADDGTRFVRVFVEIIIEEPSHGPHTH